MALSNETDILHLKHILWNTDADSFDPDWYQPFLNALILQPGRPKDLQWMPNRYADSAIIET